MATISGIPYFEVEFTKDGKLFEESQKQAVLDALAAGTFTDLVVVSHGWNNDREEARSLYQSLFTKVADLIEDNRVPPISQRKLAIAGVFWPSKKFADPEDIPGGGMASAEEADETETILELLDLLAQDLEPEERQRLEAAKRLVPRLEDSVQAQRDVMQAIRSVLPAPDTEAGAEDRADAFFSLSGEELIEIFGRGFLPTEETEGGGAGLFDGIGEFFEDVAEGVQAGLRRVLNYATYYQMKERAGVVGKEGLNALLAAVRTQNPNVKLHLWGHSFGGRLVTAAADGRQPFSPASMGLLQAAFSHHGFAEDFDGDRDGFFRRIASENKVSGPIYITHSKHDRAVGIAYPLASRLAGQNSATLGGPNDQYGGIGRNGAIKTPEARFEKLQPVGEPYDFGDGAIYNLEADAYIKDHGDVHGREVAYVLLAAIAAT